MRLSVALALLSLAGVLAGAWLVGRWAFGTAVIFDSLAIGIYGLLRDDGARVQPQIHGVPTISDVLDRSRRSS